MKKFSSLFVALAAVSFCAVASAENEVVVTGASAKSGGTALSLDVVSDGNAVAFNFAVDLPGTSEKSVDLSACTSGLPKGWNAVCSMKGSQVRVAALGDLASPLPKGVVSVGQIRVNGLKGAASMSEVEFSDAGGSAISTKGSIDLQ